MTQPEWFNDFATWWDPAVGEDVARNVEPVDIDGHARVRVRCSSTAWGTLLRLIAPRLIVRINALPGTLARVEGLLVETGAATVPQIVVDRWADLMGEDLADQIAPYRLGHRGQELCAQAASADARDEGVRRGPEILERIRELIGEDCTVTRWTVTLRPVRVLIASSPQIRDRAAVETVLEQIWHDAVQVHGPTHLVALEHGDETMADRFVDAWAQSLDTADGALLISGPVASGMAGPDLAGPEPYSGRPDLCVSLIQHVDEALPLEEKARAAGVPVQRVQLDG
ncbi:DciA family protein [Streptomyces sp. NPDC093108]|uniref:DciA family protein n=1 Tax=Streptomyces sp. NPDC093108 TaxID=3366030 RepID=UPI0038025A78